MPRFEDYANLLYSQEWRAIPAATFQKLLDSLPQRVLAQLQKKIVGSDTNFDICGESKTCCCPPRTFLPALCRIFLDECAPDNVLEVTARAITYYLDVSAECTRRIVAVDGAIKAICNRLVVADVSSRASKDLSEQCIKACIKFIYFF
ncbi:e3 ubiquitin-protein ligase Ufd4 [Trichonephila clavipes]|nr:e3 ubiquitin-protein ligase Ufd4 [Trichonephila clavipes]